MRNTQSPVATVSGESTPTERPTPDFPTVSLGSHSSPGEDSAHSSWGHLRWPGILLQVTPKALIHPHSEQSTPSSAQISDLRNERTHSPDAQWGILIRITWGTLNILELWTNTNYLKGNLWSEGTKHGYAKCLINETWRLDWAPFSGEKHPPTLFFFPSLTKV